MGKKLVLHNGKLKTIREIADETGEPYHTIYQRYLAIEEGKPKRKTAKQPVIWNGVEYPSISALARELGYSRQWVSQLVKKQEEGQ